MRGQTYKEKWKIPISLKVYWKSGKSVLSVESVQNNQNLVVVGSILKA